MKNIYTNDGPPMEHRPICPQCKKRLRPLFHTERSEKVPFANGGYTFQNYVAWKGQYHGYGAFDTMRCAVDYANKIEQHGVIKALQTINRTIYSVGAPLGSNQYFAVRAAAADTLRKLGESAT